MKVECEWLIPVNHEEAYGLLISAELLPPGYHWDCVFHLAHVILTSMRCVLFGSIQLLTSTTYWDYIYC